MKQVFEARQVIHDLNFQIAKLNQDFDCFLSCAKEIVCTVPNSRAGEGYVNYCFNVFSPLEELRAQFDEVVRLNQNGIVLL